MPHSFIEKRGVRHCVVARTLGGMPAGKVLESSFVHTHGLVAAVSSFKSGYEVL